MISFFRVLSRNALNGRISCIPKRSMSTMDDDGDLNQFRTRVSIENHEEGMFVEAYSSQGLRLSSGLGVIGPCVIFPKSILHWNISGVQDINEDSLRLFTMLDPKLELLVLGLGERQNVAKLNPDALRYLRSKKLNIEVLPSEQAYAVFNFLNSENRYVAGAFIPPSYINHFSEDILPTKMKL